MPARALMFQGTGSDVGKSLIVAGLARAFTNRGLRVRPFKPQNMSNNAAVAADGGEIGRAQALQARACRVTPSVHMNPVLLKPQSEIGAQVVVHGRAIGTSLARDYQHLKPQLMEAVQTSFAKMKAEADLVLVEGAGSVSEINLRANDIANMGFARQANVPVVLVGDIDRGGVIAQIAGTTAVIDPEDAKLLLGFIVNKFRGDPTLFAAGMRAIEEHSGLPSLGLIPFFKDAYKLPAEDAMALTQPMAPPLLKGGSITVAVPILPRISNFDDLDPLKLEPAVRLIMVPPGSPIPPADVIILPGSKSTIADLGDLRREGWDIDIVAHARHGGRVLGLCGGYQMLGHIIADPEGIEGPPGEITGLGLLDVATRMLGPKTLTQVHGTAVDGGATFSGYEMHIGITGGPGCARPLLRYSDGRTDGAVSPDGSIAGCYVHGLFGHDAFRAAWLAALHAPPSAFHYEAAIDKTLDDLAAHLAQHVDLDRLIDLAR